MNESQIVYAVSIFQLNLWGLVLEIIGFLIMLISMRRLKWKEGPFDGGNPTDNREKNVYEILGVPYVWVERSGIITIILGLCMQATGVWLGNPF